MPIKHFSAQTTEKTMQSMHDYAVFGHNRTAIGRWLGVGSLLITGGLTQLIAWLNAVTGWEAFTKATVTASIIYFGLHWVFTNWAWKIPFFSIPDLNGTWKFEGKTLKEDGKEKYAWTGEIGIEQNWEKIIIHLKTSTSQSKSYTATLSKRHGPTGGWLLSYSYRNEPEIEQQHQLNSHKGYCEIEFNNELTIAKAAYFNSAERRSFGTMNLKKEK
jgi:hypothetical protein